MAVKILGNKQREFLHKLLMIGIDKIVPTAATPDVNGER